MLDWFEQRAVEGHSLMVVRHGHVVAEGWWAPYSAERPTLLYSVTKSFTSMAVGLVIADGLLSLDDRVVDVLPDHVPDDISERARRVTVHDLLSMTAGHGEDSLAEAWELSPGDLVAGFLRVPFGHDGFAYDNATTFVLARMVERVSGRDLRELLDERLLRPMGIEHAEWDRVASGKAFGFHGLHLTTEAVAAFGELLLRGGRWGDRQLIPGEWVERATRPHSVRVPLEDDSASGYGYQIWIGEHGFYADGAFGQHCVVFPSLDLVVVVTSHSPEPWTTPNAIWDCLAPGIDHPDTPQDDALLAARLRTLSFPLVEGAARAASSPARAASSPARAVPSPARAVPSPARAASSPARAASTPARAASSPARAVPSPARAAPSPAVVAAPDSALPEGSTVRVEPVGGGWRLHLESIGAVEVGHGAWRESAPLGRPVVASGAWQGDTFVAHLFVITTPHWVRLVIDGDKATAIWSVVPLTKPDLALHLRSPLMTRPDVA
ncbi:serine hydrolase domain-containing protein [Paractinoplanes atraurantiacus]|uniref:serine hydrolase domain-containing protein n=1 Tax=Paractinoplanes atraurantiacus TaxID=1036182 RepID=UPI001FE7C255|nr:serine hydrolase [Actinoplanes atraurantiacus]